MISYLGLGIVRLIEMVESETFWEGWGDFAYLLATAALSTKFVRMGNV